MNTLVNVGRYHLVDRFTWLAMPWGIMAFSFLVNIGVCLSVPAGPRGIYTGGLVSLYIFMLLCGALSMTRSLPFGLMMGISRRTYYAGTALLVLTLGVVYGLGLTLLQLVERATNGWGLRLHYFRIPWIMDGPWYETWLTSFVLLVVFVLYGMWYGLVFRRWSVPGLVAFIAAQILVALLAVVALSATHSWSGVGHFFTTVTALGPDRRAGRGGRGHGARRAQHPAPGHRLMTGAWSRRLETGEHRAEPVQVDPLGRVFRGVLRVEPPVEQPQQGLGGKPDLPVGVRTPNPVRQGHRLPHIEQVVTVGGGGAQPDPEGVTGGLGDELEQLGDLLHDRRDRILRHGGARIGADRHVPHVDDVLAEAQPHQPGRVQLAAEEVEPDRVQFRAGELLEPAHVLAVPGQAVRGLLTGGAVVPGFPEGG
jgi:hypothetical protein